MISLIPVYLETLKHELAMKRDYLDNEPVDTIYFGGGTPSLLSLTQVQEMLDHIKSVFNVSFNAEITLEANPDDLSPSYLKDLSYSPVNRLSIGVQSFNDRYLSDLNRRHNALQALECISNARKLGFTNISIDLIYGLPEMTNEVWKNTLSAVPDVEHISAYHLTIEPGTAFYRKAQAGLLSIPSEDASAQQFYFLHEFAAERNMIHYEISNIGKEGFFSRHNTAYWQRKKYLGAGPSAHSYDGRSRQWNIRDVRKYIECVNSDSLYFEKEELSITDRFNEYLLVTLRTIWGADRTVLLNEFGSRYLKTFESKAIDYANTGHLVQKNGIYCMTPSGWLISDHILSDLVIEN